MSKKNYNEKAYLYSIRLHNVNTVNLINELSKTTGNRNAILNEALDIGIPLLHARIFGKGTKKEIEQTPYSPSVGRELKLLRRVIDDLFIEMNVQETMLAGLFNALIAQTDGEEINAESLRDGSLCDLPELVARIKEDLLEERGSIDG